MQDNEIIQETLTGLRNELSFMMDDKQKVEFMMRCVLDAIPTLNPNCNPSKRIMAYRMLEEAVLICGGHISGREPKLNPADDVAEKIPATLTEIGTLLLNPIEAGKLTRKQFTVLVEKIGDRVHYMLELYDEMHRSDQSNSYAKNKATCNLLVINTLVSMIGRYRKHTI